MMEENQGDRPILSSIDFIFLHSQLILFSFLIIFNIFQAYATTIPPMYVVQSHLLFEETVSDVARRIVSNEKKAVAEKILTGTNIEPIIQAVIGARPQAERKAAEADLRSALLNPKKGIYFNWESKEDGYILRIEFAYTNPMDCYRAIKAATDRVISESEQKVTREMETNLLFLNKQLKFYKDKVDVIDLEMGSVRSELARIYPGLSDEDSELVSRTLGGKEALEKKGIQKSPVKIAGASILEMDLAELQDKRKRLNASLEDGTFVTQKVLEDIDDEDLFLKEHKLTIAAKEMEVDSLLSRGYKEEHPQVMLLRNEIARSKEIRQNRMARLKPAEPGSPMYDDVKEKVNFDIKELDFKIALILNRMKGVNVPGKTIAAQPESSEPSEGNAKELVSKFKSLENERAINETYFFDMRKNLANVELKLRTENESAGLNISVIQEPEVPTEQDVSKARRLTIRGFIFALVVGLGLGYLAFTIKGSIHYDHELYNLLEIPVIATISNLTIKSDSISKKRRFIYTILTIGLIIIASRVVIGILFSAK